MHPGIAYQWVTWALGKWGGKEGMCVCWGVCQMVREALTENDTREAVN